MSLLMPEYERQLRAAARRLAGDSAAVVKPARSRLGSWLLLGFTAAVTVAVAAAAVVLIGHRGQSTPAAGPPATQYNCAPHQILRTKGPLVPTARGTVRGQRWTLELDSARHGLRSVQAGRLMLGGRGYGFCKTGLDLELVNAGPHGIAYGLAARPYRPPIDIEATTKHGTAGHPVKAHDYPARTRDVPQATLFLRALPASACAYDGLAVSASERPANSGTGQGVLTFYSFTRACARGQLRQGSRR